MHGLKFLLVLIYIPLYFSFKSPENIILPFESNSKAESRSFEWKEETGYEHLGYDSTICISVVLDQEVHVIFFFDS